MTPGARVSAAIEILDMIAEGTPVERALTNWARGSRFAGSKDRAAVRDHVFDVQRNLASDRVRGGGASGRQLMLGRLRAQDADLDQIFNAAGHAPSPLSDAERAAGQTPEAQGDQWNLPEWIIPEFERSLGDKAEAAAHQLQNRAPITLRVNVARTTPSDVAAELAIEGIETQPNPVCDTALTITQGPRKLRNSQPYLHGMVELQDAASQAIASNVQGASLKILDYCAGGGGKALALAALGHQVTAHDLNVARMSDLPDRAVRAGVQIMVETPDTLSPDAEFDVVLCDAPCSGSGAWRRSPAGKWTLTQDALSGLTKTQDEILDQAQQHVAPGGQLVFATCSVLRCENEDRADAFVARHPTWNCIDQTRISVSDASDGFFHATFSKLV